MIEENAVAIQMENVHKKLGNTEILRGINLSVKYGEIIGIIGPNGSGKTLILRLLCGLAYPTQGRIMIGDTELKPGRMATAGDSMGVLIETPGFLPYLSGMNNLELLSSIKRKITKREIVEAMYEVGLNPQDSRPVRKYSLGMKQRLGIAQAIMERPRILLLDEPTNGLDPDYSDKFLKFLSYLRQEGISIVLTSHELNEVGEISDNILSLHEGQLVQYQYSKK